MNPFGRAEKKQTEEERRDHECPKNYKQKRVTADPEFHKEFGSTHETRTQRLI